MTTRACLTPRAEADIDAQVAWLAKQPTCVALEFFDAVQITIQSIEQSPESGSVWEFEETVTSSAQVSFFKVRGFPNHLRLLFDSARSNPNSEAVARRS